jgi:2-oxoglutarate dehydrogenase E2 component (dihydrolipoamide succinyltransferase)
MQARATQPGEAREVRPPTVPEQARLPAAPGASNREEEVIAMTPFRRTIAERLVQSKNSAALLTTFNEVDLSMVQELRHTYQDAFLKRHQVKLGLMSFFVKAAVEALKQIPVLNAEVRGNDVVYKNYFDIGVAVGGGRGLVVPVIRNAEYLGLAEIERAIADFAGRAKDNKLQLAELVGGTFTVSNGGVYGSMLSTPIINPPQSGILGLHSIQDRPVAHQGQVVIRPMMYIALTYDHRIVDGREAVTFLRLIKDFVEQPARILLEV